VQDLEDARFLDTEAQLFAHVGGQPLESPTAKLLSHLTGVGERRRDDLCFDALRV